MNGLGGVSEGMGFDMPMLMNQSQQFFGGPNPDASPVPPVMPAPAYHDDSNMGTGDESNEAKRRRIARVRWCLSR